MKFSAVILAGGESRRMGRDKAWLEFEGQPLIARAVERARKLGIQEIFISGRKACDYSALGCPVLFDLEPGFGPLAGIERALAAAGSPLVLVMAVDLPRLRADFVEKLLAHCGRGTGVVPEWNGRLEPLAAIYPRRCFTIARDCLARSRLAACEFAEACLKARAVRKFRVASQDAGCFVNWNRPSDASRRAGRSAAASRSAAVAVTPKRRGAAAARNLQAH